MGRRWAMAAMLATTAATVTPAAAKDAAAKDAAADPLAGTRAQDGLFRVNVDARGGRILATLPPPGADGVAGRYLYTPAIRSGLGAAPAVLDRGKIGDTQLVAFRRIGRKVAIEFENPRFRAPGGKSQDFATSIALLADIVATAPDGSLTIDLAPFLTADTLGIAAALGNDSDPFTTGGGAARGGGGGFRLDPALSVADPASARVFPRNVELDAVQTFTAERAGAEVSNIAPDPRRVTLGVHHSFVALPDAGYRPRLNDARVGGFSTQAVDYARPLGADVVFDLANRFRLEKTDPAAARSRVKQPIVFYIDPAAPDWVRGALIEGGNWWGQAFDAAGYVDAFQVKPLPAGADPLDARYSMVTWVDRATRGWAYGQQVVDPRTGEIVRGMVVLGSERARQDIQIYQGLVGAAGTGQGGPNDPAQVALARLRQLSAHEIGHSLGFAHNFAASTQDRASVMDYPPPRIGLVDGRPDLRDAYATGIGPWDKVTAQWLYGEPAPGTDAEAWARGRAQAAVAAGWRFVQDDNARAPNTGQMWGGLWDDGTDPVAELDRLMTVRRAAIDRFGAANLAPGEPAANLRRRFVPIYLLHRYQLVAAAKSVGGVDFAYAVAGDGRLAPRPAPAATQRAAIAAILRTVAPAALRLPPALPGLLSVPANGSYNRQFDIELFDTAGGPVFDPLAAADAAAQLAFGTLLAPQRLQRLEVQHAADPAQPGVAELLDRIAAATAGPADALGRRVATRAIVAMAQAARAAATPPEAAALLTARVRRTATALAARPDDWAQGFARQLLDREALDRLVAERPRMPTVPPGDPIGDDGWMGDLLP